MLENKNKIVSHKARKNQLEFTLNMYVCMYICRKGKEPIRTVAHEAPKRTMP